MCVYYLQQADFQNAIVEHLLDLLELSVGHSLHMIEGIPGYGSESSIDMTP